MKRMSYILSLALCMAMPVIASEDVDQVCHTATNSGLEISGLEDVAQELVQAAEEPMVNAVEIAITNPAYVFNNIMKAKYAAGIAQYDQALTEYNTFNDQLANSQEAADAALKTGWLAWGLSMIPSKAQAGEAVRTIPTHLKAIPSYAKTFGTWFIDYNKMLNGSRLDRASEFGARALIVVAGLATLKKIYSMATAKTEEDEQVPVIFYGD